VTNIGAEVSASPPSPAYDYEVAAASYIDYNSYYLTLSQQAQAQISTTLTIQADPGDDPNAPVQVTIVIIQTNPDPSQDTVTTTAGGYSQPGTYTYQAKYGETIAIAARTKAVAQAPFANSPGEPFGQVQVSVEQVQAPPGELVAKSLVPHPSGSGFDGFDLTYAIKGADLPNSTDIQFFWSNTNTWSRASMTNPDLNFVVAHPPITTAVTGNSPASPVYTVHLAGNDFVAPPPQDNYLIAVLNYSDLLPASYPEDSTATAFTSSPAAQFVVKPVAGASDPMRKLPYAVSVVITNPGPAPVQFPMKWEEVFLSPSDLRDYPGGAQQGQSGNVSVGPIPVGGSVTIPIGTFTRTWDWIGQYPFSSADDVSKFFTTTGLKELAKALEKKATGTAILKQFSDLQKAIDVFNDLITNPVRHAEIRYRVDSTVNPPDHDLLAGFTDVQLSVPGKNNAALVAFEAAYMGGKELLKASIKATIQAALIDPTKFSLAETAAIAAAGALLLEQSKALYAQAVDPPDPQYRQLPTPQVLSIAELDSLPAGPYKDLAEMALNLLAVTRAEATAQNRADGALEAGDLFWESQQLIAASAFSSQAAELQERFNALYASLESNLRARLAGLDGQVYPYLQANGLPPMVTQILGQFGWTATDIDNLRQNMVALGSSLLTEEEPVDDVLRLLPFTYSVAASEQLTQGVGIQTADLGAVVGHLAASERAALDRQQASILAQFSASTQSWSVYSQITAFAAEVRQDLLQTHNADELQNYLDFGQSALVNFAAITPTPITISPTTLAPAKLGVRFSQNGVAGGGDGPLHFGIASGRLPLGMTLNPDTGVLAGIPQVAGTFRFFIGITDSSTSGGPYSVTQQLTLTVQQANAARLVFLTQPGKTLPNGLLGPFQVRVLDQFGNPLSGVVVTLRLVPMVAQRSQKSIAGSTVQAMAVNGVASFSQVTIPVRGLYKMGADIGGAFVLSDPFTVGLFGRQG
jgi:hypothetical protein